MKFLVDMPVSPQLAKWLNEKGHNAVHVSDIGLHKIKDRDIIDEARKQERIIIINNLKIECTLSRKSHLSPLCQRWGTHPYTPLERGHFLPLEKGGQEGFYK